MDCTPGLGGASIREAPLIGSAMAFSGTTCITEPYNASTLPTELFWASRVKIVTYICARAIRVFPVYHVARGRKTYGFPVKTYETTLGSLIQRYESTICWVKRLVLIHSACPYKKLRPKCSQFPHELFKFAFSSKRHTKQKKLVQISPYSRARFIALSGLKIV